MSAHGLAFAAYRMNGKISFFFGAKQKNVYSRFLFSKFDVLHFRELHLDDNQLQGSLASGLLQTLSRIRCVLFLNLNSYRVFRKKKGYFVTRQTFGFRKQPRPGRSNCAWFGRTISSVSKHKHKGGGDEEGREKQHFVFNCSLCCVPSAHPRYLDIDNTSIFLEPESFSIGYLWYLAYRGETIMTLPSLNTRTRSKRAEKSVSNSPTTTINHSRSISSTKLRTASKRASSSRTCFFKRSVTCRAPDLGLIIDPAASPAPGFPNNTKKIWVFVVKAVLWFACMRL